VRGDFFDRDKRLGVNVEHAGVLLCVLMEHG